MVNIIIMTSLCKEDVILVSKTSSFHQNMMTKKIY